MLLRYNNSERHQSSLAKLQYIFISTFCEFQIPRYGRYQKDWSNFVSTWDFLFKPVYFLVNPYVLFQKLSLAALNLESIH